MGFQITESQWAFCLLNVGKIEKNQRKASRDIVGFHKAIETCRFTQGILQVKCLESRFLSMFWYDKGFKADGYNVNIIKPFSDNSIIMLCPLRIGRTAALNTFHPFVSMCSILFQGFIRNNFHAYSSQDFILLF